MKFLMTFKCILMLIKSHNGCSSLATLTIAYLSIPEHQILIHTYYIIYRIHIIIVSNTRMLRPFIPLLHFICNRKPNTNSNQSLN